MAFTTNRRKEMEKRYGGHGYDAKGDTFGGIAAAVLYMLLEAVRGAYRRQSDLCAACCGPLWGKRVIDMGCGFGTTTVAIAQHNPSEILAIDNSHVLANIFQKLLMESNLGALITLLHAEEVSGRNSAKRLAWLLRGMRDEFKNSAFQQRGGAVNLIRGSCLELSASGFDAMVGNNFVHWPINGLRKQLGEKGMDVENAHHEAVVNVLRSLGAMLKPGGKIGLLEPKNFVVIDTDPELDQMIAERSSVLTHPVYVRMDTLTNELLARDYSIIREPARSAPLFKTSEVPGLFAEAGFGSVQIYLRETAGDARSPQEMVEAVFASTPMHLAGVDLPMEEKIRIAKRLRRMARKILPANAFDQPMREVSFVFTATKV